MKRKAVSSGAPWEAIVGYRRAVKIGDTIEVSGTTSVINGVFIGEGDAYLQAKTCFTIIKDALQEFGANVQHIIRSRIYVTDIEGDWESIGKAHFEFFETFPPATTMIEVSKLIDPRMKVEIEVTAKINA